MSKEQSVDLTIPTSKIVAIGRLTEKGVAAGEKLQTIMLQEVPATVNLYLQGRIEHWYVQTSQPGVVLIINAKTIEEAHELLEALPLGVAGMMVFDLIPVGPLSPLRFLLTNPSI